MIWSGWSYWLGNGSLVALWRVLLYLFQQIKYSWFLGISLQYLISDVNKSYLKFVNTMFPMENCLWRNVGLWCHFFFQASERKRNGLIFVRLRWMSVLLIVQENAIIRRSERKTPGQLSCRDSRPGFGLLHCYRWTSCSVPPAVRQRQRTTGYRCTATSNIPFFHSEATEFLILHQVKGYLDGSASLRVSIIAALSCCFHLLLPRKAGDIIFVYPGAHSFPGFLNVCSSEGILKIWENDLVGIYS